MRGGIFKHVKSRRPRIQAVPTKSTAAPQNAWIGAFSKHADEVPKRKGQGSFDTGQTLMHEQCTMTRGKAHQMGSLQGLPLFLAGISATCSQPRPQ
jgi:hypothetical protein